ncbi:NosD domain-containing protein [Isoptericola sp. 178]|nr:NosD domain-containing protein [Isoptericola sp. 178]MDO8143795.1 NosD domain-containing protein [Isoptericola sp. 178]
MVHDNVYDVTTWTVGNPHHDVGEVINSIIADVKSRQKDADVDGGGKPGAVIYIPPGDYHLRTQVVIDVSYLRIEGSGHGFTSSSIRFNTPEEEWADLHELWPGGSRVLVESLPGAGSDEAAGAAFFVGRAGEPRLSSVEFADFCIDGLHFTDDGTGLPPENSYVNGKTGIRVASANDSFRVTGMGLVYLEHGLTIHHADALSVHDNFIAECGSCISLRGWGQASKVTDNLVGAGFRGHAISAENHGGLLITANNVFPRGASSIHLDGVTRSSVTNNRLHSFYPGMVVLDGDSCENLVATNHFLRDQEPWTPFLGVGNGTDDLYGLLRVSGSNNSVVANHFSAVIGAQEVRPAGADLVIVRLVEGAGNFVATNHTVASDVHSTADDSCFAAQVGALLAPGGSTRLAVTTVHVDPESAGNTVLDSGSDAQVRMDRGANAFRATPTVGA